MKRVFLSFGSLVKCQQKRSLFTLSTIRLQQVDNGSSAPPPPPQAKPKSRRVQPSDARIADLYNAEEPLAPPYPVETVPLPATPLRGVRAWTHQEGPVTSTKTDSSFAHLPEEVVKRIQEKQAFFRDEDACSIDLLIRHALHYLMAAQHNEKLVSVEEEQAIFSVLQERLREVHVEQLLDLVGVQDHTVNPSISFATEGTLKHKLHWPPSTEERYGIVLKDRIRDRIAQVMVAAAEQQQQQQQQNHQPEEGEGAAPAADDTPIYAPSAPVPSSATDEDLILKQASTEVTPSFVLRALCIMGLSAGRRKRDVAFFSLIGSYFLFYINKYKSPTELIGVLTALKRAKIIPSHKFLDAIGRRLPVVNKKDRLTPLWCYRAMVNLSFFKCDQMNTYRFLADNTCDQIEKRLQEEAQQKGAQTLQVNYETLLTDEKVFEAEKQKQVRRFVYLTSFDRLSMFTRWLYVLSVWGAPHQQYFRPFVQPLMVPLLPFFPPPSLTRLLRTMRSFKTSDREMVEPLIDYFLALEAHGKVERLDSVHVLLMLNLLAQPDSTLPANYKAFFGLCFRVLQDTAALCTTSERVSDSGIDATAQHQQEGVQMLRPREMCTICNYTIALQTRQDIPLEDVQPLLDLVEAFASRLLHLLQLKVVSLRYMDLFLDLTRAMQHPDEKGVLAQLEKERVAVEQLQVNVAATDMHGEEAYYAFYDVDVRDVFAKLLVLNDATTYHHYTPLPGAAQVDFRLALTDRSVLDILSAVDLYEQAFPGALKVEVKRLLTRSVLEKLLYKGEEVVESTKAAKGGDHADMPAFGQQPELVLRPPSYIWMTREDVQQFLSLMERCPLEKVKTSREVWEFVRQKAERLQLTEEEQVASLQLQRMTAAA